MKLKLLDKDSFEKEMHELSKKHYVITSDLANRAGLLNFIADGDETIHILKSEYEAFKQLINTAEIIG